MDEERWRRVGRLLSDALARDAGEREAYLADLASREPDLAAEVRALLAAHRDAEACDFLATAPPAVTPAHLERDGPDVGLDLQVGDAVGPYTVVRPLGRGGMGAVYLAERSDDQYRQRVALKVVRRGLDTEDVLRRFRNERQILADLEHPNIARLLDGGMTGDGRPYLVMEFIDGLTILDYCDRHRLSVDRRLALFRQVCLAAHHAHRKLVVHRDLKPSNVLVTGDGRPKLLDFGVAKLLAEGPESRDLTRPGVLPLSPEYASPEQVTGSPVSTATDVYGLGLVLYELLCGRRAQPVGRPAWSELERVVCRESPPAPSDALPSGPAPETRRLARDRATTPERLRRKLRGDLDTIVLTALHKESDRRYASAEQMAEDLRRHLDGLPVRARRDTLRYRGRKFLARHAVGVAATLLLVLTLVAGALATAWQAREASAERDRSRAEAAKAEAVAGFLTDLFRASDPTTARDDSVTVTAVLDRARERLPSALAGQRDLRSDLLDVLGQVYTNLGRYEDARDALGEALDLRRAEVRPDSAELAGTLLDLAEANRQARDFELAAPHFREAVAIHRALARASPADTGLQLRYAGALANQAMNLRELGRADTAVVLVEDAIELRERLQAADDPGLLSARTKLAFVLRGVGRVEEAEAIYRDVLARHRESGVLPPDDLAPLLNNLAYLLVTRQAFGEAEQLYREALGVHRELYGPGHPRTLMIMNNLAGILNRQGRHAELEVLSRRMLALQQEHRPPDHWRIGDAHRSLGSFLASRGRLREAEAEHRAALRIFQAGLGEDHPWTANQRSLVGEVLARQGRRAEAEPLLLRGLADLRASDREDAAAWAAEAAARVVELYEAWDRPGEAARYRTLASADGGA